MIILASGSATRAAMLSAAGVSFEAKPAPVDEDAAKAAFRAQGMGARDLADALAEMKAIRVSQKHPQALVLGCDQTLALDDGTMLDKAETREQLATHLRMMSGRTHSLYSAAVLVRGGVPEWRAIERVKLTMRALSDDFIDAYVAAEGDAAMGCGGGYMIESRGVQLFSKIEGSHFAILGLPLLGLLDHLRVLGELAS